MGSVSLLVVRCNYAKIIMEPSSKMENQLNSSEEDQQKLVKEWLNGLGEKRA